jgi:hypothetical protein
MKYSLFVLLSVFLLNCKEKNTKNVPAESLVDQSIEISGGEIVKSSTIAFNFRDTHYKAIRHHGKFQFEREFQDSTSVIKDVLSNENFKRFVNDVEVKVADSMVPRYSASVNSVHYFSVLPYGLNDTAVKKVLLEDISIKNENYHSVQVTFDEDGGGEDFEDVFIYWIHSETYKVAYLAYSYNESDGKGIRFREAYNERYVEGIRFVDYNNFKPENTSVALRDLPQLFENGDLKLLSKIKLESITVNRFN